MQYRYISFMVSLLFWAAVLPASAQEDVPFAPEDSELSPTQALIEELGAYPCMDGLIQCITLTQPLDHNNPEDDRTIDVVFTVLPATGERKGTFVIIVGGPGGSGIESATWYFGVDSRFDPRLNEHYDIVMFDPRGIALSDGGYDLDCPNVPFDFTLMQELALTEESETLLVDGTRRFAEACLAEIDQEILPFIGTNQVVADLEAIFEALGADQVWLYGESYGTQVAQLYATRFPERVQLLMIDGVVNLTLTGPEYYETSVARTQTLIEEYLEACNALPVCANDFGGNVIAAYEALHEQLAASSVEVDFPLPNGQTEARLFTLEDLLRLTPSMSPSVLRWLAAALQGDFVPLMRAKYAFSGSNAQTMAIPPFDLDMPIPDNVGYFNVDCTDYDFFEGTPDERAQAFMDAGDDLEARYPLRNVTAMYNNLTCAFWPTMPSRERPAPFTGSEDYPTFVLNGTSDLATPVPNGYGVFSNIENAYMITRRNGGHVIFGRGDACPDQLLMNYLVDNVLPKEREYLCEGELIDSYMPIQNALPTNATAETLALALKTEIEQLPEIQITGNTLVGCPFGGVLSISAAEQIQLNFADCRLLEKVSMTGTGSLSSGYGAYGVDTTLQLDIVVGGDYEGWISFFQDTAQGLLTLDGELNGESLRPIP